MLFFVNGTAKKIYEKLLNLDLTCVVNVCLLVASLAVKYHGRTWCVPLCNLLFTERRGKKRRFSILTISSSLAGDFPVEDHFLINQNGFDLFFLPEKKWKSSVPIRRVRMKAARVPHSDEFSLFKKTFFPCSTQVHGQFRICLKLFNHLSRLGRP